MSYHFAIDLPSIGRVASKDNSYIYIISFCIINDCDNLPYVDFDWSMLQSFNCAVPMVLI